MLMALKQQVSGKTGASPGPIANGSHSHPSLGEGAATSQCDPAFQKEVARPDPSGKSPGF